MTKDRIVRAYIDLAGAGGITAASIRNIAARLGVSIGAVQHYYPSREVLVQDAFRETIRRVGARLADVDLEGCGPHGVTAALHELLPLDDERRAECQVYLQLVTLPNGGEELRSVRATSRKSMRRWISVAIRAVVPGADTADGGVLTGIAEAIALIVDGTTVRLIDEHDHDARESVLQDFDVAVTELMLSVVA